jgi:hypothetical protein
VSPESAPLPLEEAARPLEETAAAVVAIAVRVKLTGFRSRRNENRPNGELKVVPLPPLLLLCCCLFQLLPPLPDPVTWSLVTDVPLALLMLLLMFTTTDR